MPRFGVECAEDLVGDDSNLLVPDENGVTGDSGIEEAIRLDRAVKVGVVISFLSGIAGRETALEGIAVISALRCRRLRLLFAPAE